MKKHIKILHTSDWHLGKKIGRFSRIGEQRSVLKEIVYIAKDQKVDLVLIAGDVFDSFNPSLEAQELFYETLVQLNFGGKVPVFVISGNHDSPQLLEIGFQLAEKSGIFLLGSRWQQPDEWRKDFSNYSIFCKDSLWKISFSNEEEIYLINTPYINQYRLGKFMGIEEEVGNLQDFLLKYWNSLYHKLPAGKVSFLLTHFFVLPSSFSGEDSFLEDEGERTIVDVGGLQAFSFDEIPPFSYLALGHLHRSIFWKNQRENKECLAIYSGSPLAYSFNEVGQEKKVVILEIEEGKINPFFVPLTSGKKLLRYQTDDFSQLLKWLEENQDAWVEVTFVCEKGISYQQRQAIYQTHSGIISLIPSILSQDDNFSQLNDFDLTQDVESLFKKFFYFKKGYYPDEKTLKLFSEIINISEEEKD